MKSGVVQVLIFTLLGLISGGISTADEPRKRPNILFLFADDQRADTIGALGNTRIKTPNLDSLVSQGTSLTRAYCMGALQGAVCVPSRAMLMTGRTLFRVKDNMDGQPAWPEAFAKAGYATFLTGKWHNQPASAVRIFPEARAVFLGGMGDPYKLPLQDVAADHGFVNSRLSGEHSVKVFADAASNFLRTRTADQPFLCYVAFNLPHDPRVAPPEYHERYQVEKPPLPANFLPKHPFNNGEMTVRDEALAPWPRTGEVVRQHLADYYASIEFLDAQVGRILEALKKSGQFENTLIVFAADSGLAIGSHGLFGKQNLYEHSMRVPLIIAGPGIPKGKRSEAFCYLLDVFPTLGDLASIPAPSGNEGLSLVPVINGKVPSIRSSIFTAYRDVQRAVRDERYKLIVYPRINRAQLFDLQLDPDEIKDISGEPGKALVVQAMTEKLLDWQMRVDDHQRLISTNPLPADFEFPDAKPKKE